MKIHRGLANKKENAWRVSRDGKTHGLAKPATKSRSAWKAEGAREGVRANMTIFNHVCTRRKWWENKNA